MEQKDRKSEFNWIKSARGEARVSENEKTVEEIIAEAMEINDVGKNTPEAYDFLNAFIFSGEAKGWPIQEQIKILDKASDYLVEIREKAMKLRERSEYHFAKRKFEQALALAEDSLKLSQKYCDKAIVKLAMDLIDKIKKEKDEEEKEGRTEAEKQDLAKAHEEAE